MAIAGFATLLKEGAFVARLTPCTMTNGEISAFAAYRDFIAIADGEIEFKNSESATEWYERRLAGGKTIKIEKVNAYITKTGGSTAAASEGGDTFKFTGIFSYDDIKFFRSLMLADTSVPVVLTFPLAMTDTGGVPAWIHLLCKFQGNLALGGKEGIFEVPVTFQGGIAQTAASGIDYADFNAASVTGKKITPMGFDEGDDKPTTGEYTISALVTGDNEAFFDGTAIMKDV